MGGASKLLARDVMEGGSVGHRDVSAAIDCETPRDTKPVPHRAYPHRTHGWVMGNVDGNLDLDLFVGNGGMNMIPDKEEPNRLFLSTK